MIQLNNISLLRGSRQLLTETSLTINPAEKVGLVGANGSGKSSLFQLLMGKLTTDAGECWVPKQWRLGYMEQEVSNDTQAAVEYVIDGDQQLRCVEQAIAQEEHPEKLASLFSRLEEVDGYTAEARAASLLAGLGFSNEEIRQPVKHFSGGWRVRLSLARALMTPADLLLLDEPTNHLDLNATLWLEGWLKRFAGTLVIVSHDRDFLDNVVDTIVHIEHQQLHRYTGNYSQFEKMRSQRLAQQQQLYEKQQAEIKHIQSFVDRFRAQANKAKQAQSRLKALARMEELAPAHVDSPFTFTLPCADKVPHTLVTFNQASIGYPDGHHLDDLNLSLYEHTRVGLLGANGAGKSTLLKSIAGELALLAGERIPGDSLAIGYFAQHQVDALHLQQSAFHHLQSAKPQASEQAVRNFLGSFDFLGDRVFEPVSNFSGGEKARLTLALIAWHKPNLLILDEPTNHLDLEMRHALTLALQDFNGALVIVSHDRHLLRNTVDDLWLVADGKVSDYDGDLNQYERWLAQQTNAATNTPTPANGNKPNKKQQRQQAAEKRAQRKPLTDRIKKLERQMETLHRQRRKLETVLADAELYEDSAKQTLQQTLQEQGQIDSQLAELEEAWLDAQAELESLAD